MDNLFITIRRVAPIPEDEETKFRRIITQQYFEKGKVFIKEGTVPNKLAYVERGLFRYYYVNQKGSEFTKGFFTENNFITSYTAMIACRPSYYTIEALEDSTILVFNYDEWKTVFRGHPCWTPFMIAMLEKGYSKKESRERELLLLTAEERYRSFIKEYPQLEKRVKQHHIASYLGITPVALSRIRKNMDLPSKRSGH
jgi:CRP-like cAMP-binding protein